MRVALLVFFSLIALLAVVSSILALLMVARNKKPFRPCFRCAAVATTEFMGLHYCVMCRIVVTQMLPAVRHDPPYGFPGASGHLEFPVESIDVEGKKEG